MEKVSLWEVDGIPSFPYGPIRVSGISEFDVLPEEAQESETLMSSDDKDYWAWIGKDGKLVGRKIRKVER